MELEKNICSSPLRRFNITCTIKWVRGTLGDAYMRERVNERPGCGFGGDEFEVPIEVALFPAPDESDTSDTSNRLTES